MEPTSFAFSPPSPTGVIPEITAKVSSEAEVVANAFISDFKRHTAYAQEMYERKISVAVVPIKVKKKRLALNCFIYRAYRHSSELGQELKTRISELNDEEKEHLEEIVKKARQMLRQTPYEIVCQLGDPKQDHLRQMALFGAKNVCKRVVKAREMSHKKEVKAPEYFIYYEGCEESEEFKLFLETVETSKASKKSN